MRSAGADSLVTVVRPYFVYFAKTYIIVLRVLNSLNVFKLCVSCLLLFSKGFALNLVPCFNFVLFASTTVCCTGRPATRYRAAKEPLPRVPTAFQVSKCARGGLQGTRYQVKARYQVGANALLLFIEKTNTQNK